MKLLERQIKSNGVVLDGGVLKVGSFFNHQIDVNLMSKMGKEIAKHFKDKGVTKILTVEASGIAFALATAINLKCNMVFAKKTQASNVTGEMYSAEAISYTRGTVNQLAVPKDYISKDDKVLIVDDFLARGGASNALYEIVKAAGATLVGVAIGIEKGFQGGGDKMREQGIDVFSLAIVDKMSPKKIKFRKQ